MTDENLTKTETLEDDETEEVQAEPVPTIEESIIRAQEKLRDEAETDDEIQGDQGPVDKQPVDKAVSEAASTLASAKKGKRRQVIEIKQPEQVASTEVSTADDEVIDPPYAWDVKTKEWFNALPKEVKKEHIKTFQGFQAHFTKENQELQRQKQRYTGANALLDEIAHEWASDTNGQVSVEAGLREIAATRRNLVNKPVETIAQLCQKTGTSPQQVFDYLNGKGVTQPAQQNNAPAQNNILTEQRIREILAETQQQSASQAALQQAQAEFNEAARETNQAGQYLYPELQDQNYLSQARVQALTNHLRETQPGLSWGEIFKRAVHQTRLIDGNGSPSSNGMRLTPQQEIQKIKAASVSVKGRGNALIPQVTKAQKGEKLEDTIARNLERLRHSTH